MKTIEQVGHDIMVCCVFHCRDTSTVLTIISIHSMWHKKKFFLLDLPYFSSSLCNWIILLLLILYNIYYTIYFQMSYYNASHFVWMWKNVLFGQYDDVGLVFDNSDFLTPICWTQNLTTSIGIYHLFTWNY